MPITVHNTAAITAAVQTMLNSQKTALDATINAARDSVNGNVDADAAALAGVVNAARDVVNANTDSKATAINSNTDAKASAVTTAVNAKGAVKSIQSGVGMPNAAQSTMNTLNVAIAAVDTAKSVVIVSGVHNGTNANMPQGGARLTSATNLELKGYQGTGFATSIAWQVVEYF